MSLYSGSDVTEVNPDAGKVGTYRNAAQLVAGKASQTCSSIGHSGHYMDHSTCKKHILFLKNDVG